MVNEFVAVNGVRHYLDTFEIRSNVEHSILADDEDDVALTGYYVEATYKSVSQRTVLTINARAGSLKAALAEFSDRVDAVAEAVE